VALSTYTDLDAWQGKARRDPGVALLEDAGVVLVVLEPGQVVIAPFARNVERAAKALRDAGAILRIVDDTEFLHVEPTARVLRERGRSGWAFGGVSIDVDFEPLPGLDYSALLLDALDGDPGSPWACGAHRELIAEARARARARPVGARRRRPR
jgi:hypothetical protein